MPDFKKQKLSDCIDYVNEKINIEELNDLNYISTENMLPNRGGITKSSGLPNANYTQCFSEGDILLSNIRPYFKKIWYATFNGGCSNDVLVLRAKSNMYSKFLYYVLSDDKFFEYDTATSKGTKMPRGDKVAIMKYGVPQYDLPKQKKIARVLSSLDNKIELNNKINKNLEQQAQAIFKSWFVDNDNNIELKNGTFSDLIVSTLGGDWGKDAPFQNYTEKVLCIRGADIPEIKLGHIGKMPTRYILTKNSINKKLVNNNLVVEISGGSPTQSTGRIALITNSLLDYHNEAMICTNFCRALKTQNHYSYFIYYYWQYLYDKNTFFSYENGTTGIKNLDLTGFLENELIKIPNNNSAIKFENICSQFFKQIFQNGKENEKLAQLRDTLLPKLMNGEIDVDKVEV